MGNHCMDCDYCGSDLRSSDRHENTCPEPAYKAALELYWKKQEEHVRAKTARLRDDLERLETLERVSYERYNPAPVKPKKPWEIEAEAKAKAAAETVARSSARCTPDGRCDTTLASQGKP